MGTKRACGVERAVDTPSHYFPNPQNADVYSQTELSSANISYGNATLLGSMLTANVSHCNSVKLCALLTTCQNNAKTLSMVDIPQFTYENSVRDDRACSCPTSVYKNVPRVDVTLTLYVSSAGSVEHERKVTTEKF